MRLFLYYTIHSTWNQLRKLFRTWVFLLVLCVLLGGGLIGLSLARFSTAVQTEQAPTEELLPENFMEFFEASNLTVSDAIELGSGFLILAIFTMQLISAEKSFSRLFLPADVNFLFASDMSPQSVLSFRLLTTLGTALIASIYLFFQLPSLVHMLGITSFAAFILLLAWCLTIAFSILLKTLIYELSARHSFLRENLRCFIFAALGIISLAFYFSFRNSEEQLLLLSAHRFFNSPASRWIPVWGWLKGMIGYALANDYTHTFILIALCLGTIFILSILIRRMPADYYEEASIQSEEIALFMEAVNSENAGLLVTRSRRHRENIERDGFHYGNGASVYFYRSLYNRFRFARFRVFSRTMTTYLLIACGGGLFVRMFMDEPSIYPPVFLLAVTVFFRTIISPMSEDIRKDSFILIPENTWKKLFFSLLGGSLNCAIDAVIPLMAGTALAGYSPFAGILFLPLVVSVDYFATSVGTFVDVAIPSSIDKTFKQVIQILFLYFGMIPDEMIISLGLISRHPAAGITLAVLVNLLLGTLFFALTGVWLDPAPGSPARNPDYVPDVLQAELSASKIGFALLAMYCAVFITQRFMVQTFSPLKIPVLTTIAAYLPIYLVGPPVFLLMTQHMRTERAEPRSLSLKRLLVLLPICFFLMYSGSFVGFLVNGFISSLFPHHVPLLTSPLEAADISFPVQTICAVLLSPIMEEYIFRRALIDRLRPFGERTALILSALLFGLFHGNLTQLFYASLLGLVFGYVYLRTGRLRYSAILHMIINFMGAVIAPGLLFLAARAFPDTPLYEMRMADVILTPQFMVFFAYLALIIFLSLFGIVLFAYAVKRQDLSINGIEVSEALKTPGMISYLVILAAVIFASV